MGFQLSSFRLLVAALCLLVNFSLTYGQVDRATLKGNVMDAQRAVIAGAQVMVVAPKTGLTRETVTGENGLYTLAALPVGEYNLTVNRQGFSPFMLEGVVLNVGDTRTMDITLQVSGVAATIEVPDTEAAPIDKSSFTVGTVIRNDQVEKLPINGRQWSALMLLAPGAVNTGSGDMDTVRFNGRGRDDNNFTLDGVDDTGVKDPRQEDNLRLIVSTESIAEFRINTQLYSAAEGTGAGGQVNLVTKSGTNDFHGSVFHFVRNDFFDARLFNDTDKDEDPFRLNQFGGSVGGPISKNKTFFFAAFEGLRQRRGITLPNTVPSASFRARVVASPQAAVLRPILDLFPAGRTSLTADVDAIDLQNKNTLNEDSFLFRIDHHFSERRSLFFRFGIDKGTATVYNRGDSLNTRNFHLLPANYVLQYQENFTPTFINETRIGVNRSPLDRTDGNGALPEGIRIDQFTRLRPTVTIGEKGTSISFVNNSTYVTGKHIFRFGGEVRFIRVNVSETPGTDLRFRSPTDFLNNRVDNFTFVGEQATLGERRRYYLPYLQDDFQATQNLTLNLGLRYEYYTVGREVHDRGRVFDFACGGYCPTGTPWYEPDRNNFAPRIGFAYALFNRKTVLRGGFGIFYGTGQNDDINAAIDNARDRFGLTRADAPTLSYPVTPFIGAGKPALPAPRSLDIHRRDIMAYNYSGNVVQELPLGLTSVIGYVGSAGHNLFSRTGRNVINPVTGKKPLPNYDVVDGKENRGNSTFHALQTSLYRRIGRGLSLGMEYMWSHAISDFEGAGESAYTQDAFNYRAEKADSIFDVRHSFNLNYIYQLPFGGGHRYMKDGALSAIFGGITISGITQARTGLPVNVTISRTPPNGDTFSVQRPDLIAGVPLVAPGRPQGNLGFINPAAFKAPRAGTFGNARRNIGRGPSLVQTDMSATKAIKFTESQRLDLRLDVFNLFNRAQYGLPDGLLGSVSSSGVLTLNPNFGASLTPLSIDVGTGTSRSFQFSFRYSF